MKKIILLGAILFVAQGYASDEEGFNWQRVRDCFQSRVNGARTLYGQTKEEVKGW